MIPVILKFGGILIAVATIVIIGSQIYNARLWIDCYPKAIQKAIPLRTKKEKILKFIFGSPFLLALIVMPSLAALEISNIQQGSSIANIFLAAFGVSFLFNLYDLLILDWLIFCFITPKYQVLEGSEHLVHEYKNYKFHLIGFIKGIFFGILISAVITFILFLT